MTHEASEPPTGGGGEEAGRIPAKQERPGTRTRPATLASTAAETVLATCLTLVLSRPLASPLVWLLVPLGLIALPGRSLSEHGLDLRLRPPSLAAHAALGAALVAFYGLIHAGVAHFVLGQRFVFRTPPSAVLPLVQEFLAVGFPEELFFRGYLQTRWNHVFGRPWRLFSARIGLGLPVQAVIFAVCHMIDGDWTRLRVVFFGLFAGWLRERSGSVLAPAVYHAVANVWYRLLLASFH